ncbi:MAG: sigma-54 dependent transcriptional regulator [Proteobacteria bacterium]|nr:sigma-54 dependent transcriptional regulator [Pseudomonadota bacterium]MBU1233793.1 sigma-54 dependent transcriptional regulator [Pseudomonadota bacterium]MBU1416969.1 sigma-54 dependent transcriptional regulator [Pseudomonadota bacterium]MBU1454680.1 sigma-54 dependent transcriptional regulator [Pseudomonadota bacterium]
MPAVPTILFADRAPETQTTCLQLFEQITSGDFHVSSNQEDVVDTLRQRNIDILFLDLALSPETNGIVLLDKIQASFPDLLIVAAVPQDDLELEQEILDRNLFYYINIPYQEAEVQLALKRACIKLGIQYTSAPEAPKKTNDFYGLIGETQAMRTLFDLISKISEDDFATVLIRGESGTGKELVAKAIHLHSRRKHKNFVPVNCAAIPDDLLESELFGYTKGAFTGATQNKIGRIQYADGGTLFLDEIGDMKPSLQAKLLRVLQEKEFEPVGGLKATPVDTRIVAATHCNLEQLVAKGQFREDLYYRLSVIPLHIPPLKDRKEDIPLLLNVFIDQHTIQRGREKFSIPYEVMTVLLSYNWKGNVRELQNMVQHMSVLYSGREIQIEDLPERFLDEFDPDAVDQKMIADILAGKSSSQTQTKASLPLQTTLPTDSQLETGQVDFNELINDYETQLIIQAMKLSSGNKKEAAKLLNLKRTTLLEKIKKKDLQGMWEES